MMIHHRLMIMLIVLWSSETLSATKCTKNDLAGPLLIDYTFGSGSSYQQGFCYINSSTDYCLNSTYFTYFDVLKKRASVKPNCQYQIDLTLNNQIVTFKGKLIQSAGTGTGSALAKATGFKLSGTHSIFRLTAP